MTMHTIALNKTALLWLEETLPDALCSTDEERAELDEIINQVGLALADIATMERSTKILETDTFIAFEHPEHGDEVELMVYDKKGTLGLMVESGFFDASDPTEIEGYLADMREQNANL